MDTARPDTPRTPVAVIQATFAHFAEDDGVRIAAAMSYFLLMAIVPVMLFANVALRLIGDKVDLGPASATVRNAADAIAPVYSQVTTWAGSWAPFLTGALVLFGMASVFGQFVGALQIIWDTPAADNPVRGFLKFHALSFALVVVVALVLIAAVAAGGVMSALGTRLLSLLARVGLSVPGMWVATLVRYTVIYLVAALFFVLAFTIVPQRDIRWADVVPGALATAALFLLGESVLSLFLGSGERFSVFGAFEFFVVLIVWIYYESLVVLWGAELTKLLVILAETRRADAPAPAPRSVAHA